MEGEGLGLVKGCVFDWEEDDLLKPDVRKRRLKVELITTLYFSPLQKTVSL